MTIGSGVAIAGIWIATAIVASRKEAKDKSSIVYWAFAATLIIAMYGSMGSL